MTDIGTEVGQKMRSAIKAKLMELDCYVDDELPDYIMVMVANKRTKSQMNSDLKLFLTAKTSAFVDWLHIVLKKLKQVHVTNPDVYKKATKRKSDTDEFNNDNIKVKKEKKDKDKKSGKKNRDKDDRKVVTEDEDCNEVGTNGKRSISDEIPVNANKLSEMRKIVIMQENHPLQSEDSFDIPLLSEVANLSNESELEVIEKRIKNVKSRLGMMVESNSEEDDDDFIRIKAEPDELFDNEKISVKDRLGSYTPDQPAEKFSEISFQGDKPKHARITFDRTEFEKDNKETKNESSKKGSVRDRLGKKTEQREKEQRVKENPRVFEQNARRSEQNSLRLEQNLHSEQSSQRLDQKARLLEQKARQAALEKKSRLDLEKSRQSILSRLGVMSKVAVPSKATLLSKALRDDIEGDKKSKLKNLKENDLQSSDKDFSSKEVASVVKVKPRVLPSKANQANKTLLLKAVADAQRSIAQTPNVGSGKSDLNLFTKKYKEQADNVRDKNSDRDKKVTRDRSTIVDIIIPKGRNTIQDRNVPRDKNATKNRNVTTDRNFTADSNVTTDRNVTTTVRNITKDRNTAKGKNTNRDENNDREEDDRTGNVKRPNLKRKLCVEEKFKIKNFLMRNLITNDTNKSKRNKSNQESFELSLESSTSEEEMEGSLTPPLSLLPQVKSPKLNLEMKQQFIVTLDGLDKEKYGKFTTSSVSDNSSNFSENPLPSKSSSEEKRRRKTPSPIIFDSKETSSVNVKISNVSDQLPPVTSTAMKNKEKCKYWPNCRLGAKCDFAHPSSNCKTFPNCKFGEKCLFIHPTCKFENSCTRRDCPYSHGSIGTTAKTPAPGSTSSIHLAKSNLQTCKFYPQCTNPQCTFYHPKPCKFGKYCKNQLECNFSHSFVPKNNNLTWRPDFKT